MAKLKDMIDDRLQLRDVQAIPTVALRSVVSKTGAGVYASSDTLYKGAVFGRDSLEVAEDLMSIKPRLVKRILITLASTQGHEYKQENEEEPGKIVHEYRSIIVDGKLIDDASMNIFRILANKWGGNNEEMAYYGSIDSTPHFLRTLGEYCRTYGNEILEDSITKINGETQTLDEIAQASIDWLINKITSSQSGMLEYKTINPHGIANKVWKDSDEFYVHENKELANHNAPIASIEVQGLAYDGLMASAELWPKYAEKYTAAAMALRDTTIKSLWQIDRQAFALGTDYDSNGNLRVIKTATANPAALLDTGFWDHLDDNDRQIYISSIVRNVMSSQFLTDAGIRSRSLSEAHLIDHWDYHGSFVSWPKETYDIAKGFRRQGLNKLAVQLENRLLNVCLKHRSYPEFVYVDEFGRVLASAPSSHSHGELMLIEGTNQPERIQAWTVSAIISIVNSRFKSSLKGYKAVSREKWQLDLENSIMASIPLINRHLTPFGLYTRYPNYLYKFSNKNQ